MPPRKPALCLLLAALPHVLHAQTTVTLTASPAPSTFGAPVVLTATITPTATGRVTFYDGVTVLGTKPLVSDAASISTIALPTGPRKLRAYYAGDATHPSATSTVLPQTVTSQPSAGLVARTLLSAPVAAIFAVADLNGDGNADLIMNDGTAFTIGVLLSKGNGTFQPAPIDVNLGQNFTVNSAAVADFNGDGIPDLALTTSLGNSFKILLGNGDGTFQPLPTVPFPGPNSVAVADFNGDGKADLLLLNGGVGGISILLGNGDGTFQSPIAAVPSTISSFVLADFNGDGKTDLAVADIGSTTLRILLGKGDGTFQQSASYPSTSPNLAVGDFNGDGKADLVLSGNPVSVLLGNGDGTFQRPMTFPAAQGQFPSVADLNGDGKLDLILSGNPVTVLLGNGDGTLQPPVFYPTTFNTSSLIVGEFNGDGRTDLVLDDGNFLLGTTVSVTPTAGTPQSAVVGTLFPIPLQVTVKDGANPIAGVAVIFTNPSAAGVQGGFVSSNTAITDAHGVASVLATANFVSGQFSVTATALGFSTLFALTNLTGPPVVVSSSGTPQQTPLGTAFSKPLVLTLRDPNSATPAAGVPVAFTAPASGASASFSSATVLTDASGSATVTATGNNTPGSYTVTAITANLSATFSLTNLRPATVTLATSANPAAFGAPLMLVATVSGAPSTGRVTFFDGVNIVGIKPVSSGVAALSTILLSAGTHKLTAYYRDDVNFVVGTSSNTVTETVNAVAGAAFAAQPAVSLPGTPNSVVVADFNGDGKADFASTSLNGVAIALGKGDGTFQPPVNYGAPSGMIASGDFNGDGNADLAILSFTPGLSSASVTILLGNGDGSFGTAVTFGAGDHLSGAYSTNMVVGDFNGDGKTDVVLAFSFFLVDITDPFADISDSEVTLLPGNGDGTFGAPISYPGVFSPFVMSDFNGDGKPDLAAVNNSPSPNLNGSRNPNLFVILANGDGTGTAVASNVSVTGPLLSGDFNGDGKPDLAASGAILLGNGDGTFQSPIPYSGTAVATGDFNGDGIIDLVTGGSILFGNGDGTFRQGLAFSAGTVLAVADFNGDGCADILTATSNGAMILLGATTAPPITLAATGGTPQSAPIGTLFALPLQVKLLSNGVPVTGATVTFTAPTSGATALLASPTATTNSSGIATVTATASSVAGTYAVTATYQGNTASFSLTNTTYAFITATAGTPQSAAISTPFPNPLQATLKDALGNPVSGVTVTLTAPTTGATATLSSPTAVTNSAGVASVTATANNTPGAYTVIASVGSLSASFSLTNTAAQSTSITATAGTPQSATVGTPFPNTLQATVKDQLGNPVSGLTVTFAVPTGGASALLSPTTVQTNASGIATVTATANNISGAYTVTAGIGTPTATFSLTNLPASSLSLASSANPATFGAPLILTATLPNSAATGRVTFFDGVNILGTRSPASGTASLSTTLLPAGTRKLTAYYSGDSNNAAATSNTLTQTVRAVAGGSLDAQSPVTLPDAQGSVLVADFNNDGKADLASPSQDNSSWWQVDLGASATVGTIVIWNRTDCCSNRLSDYWVFLSNTPFAPTDTPYTLQNRAGTFSSHQTTVPSPSIAIPVNGAQGRYVRVQLYAPGYLSLAEVQVFGTGAQSGTNLALGKTASQSSTIPGYPSAGAAAAVDGNTDGSFYDGSVTSTTLFVVSISLGNGDGSFQPPILTGGNLGVMAAGDFNGDGNMDLAFSSGTSPGLSVSILLGNGDGTFRASVSYPVSQLAGVFVFSSSIVVGDFNSDGRPDILVDFDYYTGSNLSSTGNGAVVLPGNGDGTFGAPVNYATVPIPFVMADFNGDGKPDLAGVSSSGSVFNLSVVLGHGDGTGTLAVSSPGLNGFSVTSVISGDFNGDGKPDLAVGGSNLFAATCILLGNGDGTFQAQAPLSFIGRAVATGDFNGDGIADLVLADSYGNTSAILFGNGDGTFRQGITIFAGAPLAIADFNGDGRADLLTATSLGAQVLLGGAAINLSASGGNLQSAALGALFANPLQVTLKDGVGNPVSGVTVTFAAPATGPGATLSSATAVTNFSGVASVTATANNLAGSYSVMASTGSLTTSFSLTNLSGPVGSSNLASGKTATQSSTFPGFAAAAASSAVDGNTDGSFSDGSVTATNLDPNPWWQVDLGASATISAVVVWNRTDCCASRLGDYWLFISDTPFLATDTPTTLQSRAGTFASHQTTAPNPSSTIPAAAQGRYVRVQLSSAGYLSLAEVQVLGTGAPGISNLSQGKPAAQSSTLPGAPTAVAASAVDGNPDGSFFDGSVTATDLDPNPWWQVDLGASASVSSLVIWNRTDCCASRLSDYWVFVSDTPFQSTDTPATLQGRAGTFAVHQTTAPSPSTTITTAAQGRYVRVQLTSAGYLSLAEVQVFGTGAPAISNLAQGKPATQSSTLAGTPPAAAATDGNTDGNFNDGSVTATNLDPAPWWQVDLGAPSSVESVVIWNRTDCCANRLSDYWVFASNTPFQPTDTPTTLQTRPGTFAVHQTGAPSPSATIPVGAQARYVRIQLPTANYLSLAEVQVFGQ